MSNLLACRPSSYGKFRDQAYDHLRAIGVPCVEAIIGNPADAAEESDRISAAGLKTITLSGRLDISQADVSAGFTPWCEAAVTMGASYLFVSVKAGELPLDTAYGRLREAGDIAAEHGLTVLMESHPDLITNGDVARQTMEGVHHPNVRVNFDTANVYFYNEGIDGVDELKKVIDFVAGVHLKDTDGGYQSWHFPALGEGVVDFPTIFRLLNQRGMHGPFSIEIEGIRGEQPSCEFVLDRVARSVQHLRALGLVE